MKTCNSRRENHHEHLRHSRLFAQHHHHQHIISSVPKRLRDEDESSETTSATSSFSTAIRRQRRESNRSCRTIPHENQNNAYYIHTKSFKFNFPNLLKGLILLVTISSALHLSQGSHLPTSYLVHKANSNNSNEVQLTAINPQSEEEVLNAAVGNDGSSTVATTVTSTDPSTSSVTTEVTPEVEPRPASGIDSETFFASSFNDASTTQASSETTSATQESTTTPSSTTTSKKLSTSKPTFVLGNSYEDSNDSNLNYISEHDHYDEYAAMKAAYDKEKSAEDMKPTARKAVERRPYLLQAADGRKYASIEAVCDDRHMTISGYFDETFKGRIYALGYSDEKECGASNAKEPQNNITFALPLGSCGVQMLAVDDNLENDLRHEVTLYIQYSAFLQQVVDEKISVSCTEIKKSPVEEFLTSNEEVLTSNRQGRRMGSMDAGKFGSTKISTRIGESWMEILAGKDPSPKSRKLSPVSVGEDVTLVISTKVLRGFDARIVNCSAHDGSRTGTADGSRAQQILDSAGCSLDKSLVPNLRRRRLPIESRNRMITLHFATFPAFKFPERDHLHIKCAVAYCQGPCPQEPCDSVLNHFGSWRDKYGRIADVLVDSTEVVNSVEVIAPDLDDMSRGQGQHFDRQSSMTSGSYSSLSNGNSLAPASQSEISGRQFSADPTSSYSSSSYSSSSASSYSSAAPAPPAAASSSQSLYGNNQVPLHQMNPNGELHGSIGNSVCVSPGTVILALVILGVVLVISATATLWFALKRSEAKKYRHIKHSPFQHAPQPYYRFSHW